jgi:hypothetical protein
MLSECILLSASCDIAHCQSVFYCLPLVTVYDFCQSVFYCLPLVTVYAVRVYSIVCLLWHCTLSECILLSSSCDSVWCLSECILLSASCNIAYSQSVFYYLPLVTVYAVRVYSIVCLLWHCTLSECILLSASCNSVYCQSVFYCLPLVTVYTVRVYSIVCLL